MSTYPGVYISESSSLSLGVAGMSGLVPLLVGNFFKPDGTEYELSDGPIYISNYAEFSAAFLSAPVCISIKYAGTISSGYSISHENAKSGEVKKKGKKDAVSGNEPAPRATISPGTPLDLDLNDITAKTHTLEKKAINLSALAVASYFNNGGGPCWLLSIASGDTIDDIKGHISEYNEFSLLGYIGDEDDRQRAQENIITYVNDNLQSFLIASVGGDVESPTSTGQPERTAVYSPDLLLTSIPQLYESGMFVTSGTSTEYVPLTSLKNHSEESERKTYRAIKNALAYITFNYSNLSTFTISPVSAVAGTYCATERARGIWKAPANVRLIGVAPAKQFTRQEHGDRNTKGINAIMWHPSSGTSIMGARTLTPADTPAWRYVPVRLLFNTVERDVRDMLSPVVFEPNSAATWQSVIAAIKNYLYLLWKKGGLYGKSAGEAFQVGLAMEEGDIDLGILRVRIGLAALRPVEFIYLEFTQDMPVTA